jgi:hypothetical protein
MSQLTRFGRRVPLPSIVQIVHELLVAQRNDNEQWADEAKDAAGKADLELGSSREEICVPPQG